ncbi:MAG: DMT family transporter [Phycisphaerales bacterium JB063]
MIDTTHALFGLGAAASAAMLWAGATVMYRRVGRVMPPVRMNLTKNILATALLSVVVGSMWAWSPQAGPPFALAPPLMGLLILSGVVGIGIGDTCFFAALNRIGARRTLLLFMGAPVATAALAWPILGEAVGPWQAAGIAITVAGVAWVIAERNHTTSDGHVDALGVAFALAAALCQAGGALMTRYVFDHGDIAAAPSAVVRIVAGSAILVLMLPIDKRLPQAGGTADNHPQRPSVKHTWLLVCCAMLMGTFLGIWLQQVAFKSDAQVGVAQTLLSTSPLFVLPIVLALGERVTWRAAVGAAVSIIGVAVLFLRSAA